MTDFNAIPWPDTARVQRITAATLQAGLRERLVGYRAEITCGHETWIIRADGTVAGVVVSVGKDRTEPMALRPSQNI